MRITTVTEYAKLLGKEPSVIRKRILSGKLKARKLGKTWIITLDEDGKPV